MAEDVADKLENAMKKGFIHTIILSALKKGPCHGYKIKKEINQNTLGFWILQDSTLYTALKQLTSKGLIDFIEEFEGERVKKVYKLTEQGDKIFNIITKRQKRIINSMFSLLNLIIDENDPEIKQFSQYIDMTSPIMINPQYYLGMSKKIQIITMEIEKLKVFEKIGMLNNIVTKLDERIEEMKEK